MAIFDNENQFYSRPAPAFVSDQPLIYRFVDFVSGHVFVATVPISILAYFLSGQLSASVVFVLTAITGTYLGLIGLPGLVALLIASPMLLAWKWQKYHLFKRVFEIVFVLFYLLCILAALIAPSLPKIK